jgi:hypothetical protein
MMEQKHHTAAYKIWHYFVECMIPQMYLYSEEYVKKFGLYSSGDPDIDSQAYQSTVRAQLTVAQMATYFFAGAPISLVNPDESKQIYGWIVAHLGDWQEEVHKDPNLKDQVPVDDLRMLDDFAKEIYPMARQHMDHEISGSRLFRSLDRLSRRSLRRDGATPVQKASEVPTEHNPMAQAIVREVDRRGGRV